MLRLKKFKQCHTKSTLLAPTIKDVVSKLHAAKWFTSVDMKSRYWQIKLDQQSKEMMTLITPFGRFPVAVKCTQDEFQRAMFETSSDIKNVLSISDNTIVRKIVMTMMPSLTDFLKVLWKRKIQP